jgi:hypothetical protein
MSRTAAQLVGDLVATRDETLALFSLGDEDLAKAYAPGKWSVRYLLHHLADSETVLHHRICRVLGEPAQTLPVFDQDGWAAALDYSRMPLDISQGVYGSVRRAVIYLAELRYETHGHLPFVHSTLGPRTLRDEFEKVAAHNAHHLGQIRTALSSVRST